MENFLKKVFHTFQKLLIRGIRNYVIVIEFDKTFVGDGVLDVPPTVIK